ncbi:MAG: hypothetical protein Q8J88_00220 [Bacteroidales bacterium]|nr:hypothetical protein [Bacteroidales bacterium]
MKNMLLLLLLAFIIGNAFSQNDYKELILIVEKKPINNQTSRMVRLQFKPGKLLQIKTVDGRKLASTNYLMQDSTTLLIRHNMAPTNDFDTISLQEITSIKGKVYGDEGRKILGGIIAISATYYGIFPVSVVATYLGKGLAFLAAMPFAGISAAGLSMTGSRRFNTTDRWELKITER